MNRWLYLNDVQHKKLASDAGISKNMLTLIKQGRVACSLATLEKLATAMGYKPSLLLHLAEKPEQEMFAHMDKLQDKGVRY